jgi:thymidylate synthase
MQRYTVYICLETALHVSGGTFTHHQERIHLYLQQLETALHVSGGTFTHHQERIHLYLQHLVSVTTLLLSAAIVEELEPV